MRCQDVHDLRCLGVERSLASPVNKPCSLLHITISHYQDRSDCRWKICLAFSLQQALLFHHWGILAKFVIIVYHQS
jgi:hypothetical protein